MLAAPVSIAPSSLTPRIAAEIVGTLSRPSKMPGHAYSIPAQTCKTGAKLRAIAGSTCSHCYACKGRYCFTNVQNAMQKRYQSLTDPRWAECMVALILDTGDTHFRWHDSGDLQGVWHLANIAQVCEHTPHVRHWLPTREYGIVQDYLDAGGVIPANLNIRLSAHFIGKLPPKGIKGCTISTVSRDNEFGSTTRYCPSQRQGGKCGSCRSCWNKSTHHVSYILH